MKDAVKTQALHSPGNAPKWPMVATGWFFWLHGTFFSLQGRRSQWKDRKSGVWLGGQPHLLSQIKLRMSSTVKELVIKSNTSYNFAKLSLPFCNTVSTPACIQNQKYYLAWYMYVNGEREKPLAAWLGISTINCKNFLVLLSEYNKLIQLQIAKRTIT